MTHRTSRQQRAAVLPRLLAVAFLGVLVATVVVGGRRVAGSGNSAVLAAEKSSALRSIQSVTRDDPSPTNATSVHWTVSFRDTVGGLGKGDFTLGSAGLAGTPAVTAVSGSGRRWTVTASTGSGTPTGSGTLRLTLSGSGGAPATDEMYLVDKTPPPPPRIETSPPGTTGGRAARFTWGNDPGDGIDHYVCSVESGPFGRDVPGAATCRSPLEYTAPAKGDGEHDFGIEGVDRAGNISHAAFYHWHERHKKHGSHDDHDGHDHDKHADFTIGGSITQLFYPGLTVPLDLTFTNPNRVAISVTYVTITIPSATTRNGHPNPACDGSKNFKLANPDTPGGSTFTFSVHVVIPARRNDVHLSSLVADTAKWPHIAMPDLPVNQDGCQATRFTIRYSGKGHS